MNSVWLAQAANTAVEKKIHNINRNDLSTMHPLFDLGDPKIIHPRNSIALCSGSVKLDTPLRGGVHFRKEVHCRLLLSPLSNIHTVIIVGSAHPGVSPEQMLLQAKTKPPKL